MYSVLFLQALHLQCAFILSALRFIAYQYTEYDDMVEPWNSVMVHVPSEHVTIYEYLCSSVPHV